MKAPATIQLKKHYVYVRRLEDANLDVIVNVWKRVAAVCEEHGCYNILVESFIGKIPIKDAFSRSEVFKKAGINHCHRIAWVHHKKESLEDIERLETLLKKQGILNGGLFPNIEEALKWLLLTRQKKA
jgi:hypothetical protein